MAQTGYSKVQIYSSSTATHTPSAGNLTNDTNGSELAINITDGKLFYKDNSGTVQVLATKGSSVVGGSNTQVQYNSSGTFAGSANLTFDGTTLTSSGFSGPLNGSVGATTANTGAFTTLSASSTVSGTGFSTYLSSPPAIGGTAAAAVTGTIVKATTNFTFQDNTTQKTAATGFGFKNRIINGAMVIDQRNSGASVTPASTSYLVDRWQVGMSQASKFTAQQNKGAVTTPAGFSNYLGLSVASAVTVGAGDYFYLTQAIEGFNIADLGWGTVNAKTVTLSFQVYSSLTGTFGGSITNNSRSYPFTYFVSVANTWTTISITIAGDTSGTWVTNNTVGMLVIFSLGIGSTLTTTAAGTWAAGGYYNVTGATSVVGTNGATFYITGVQLEAGSTATSFDYRPYGTELDLCQRYLPAFNLQSGSHNFGIAMVYNGSSGGQIVMPFRFPVTTRVPPTGITYTGTATNLSVYCGATLKYLTSNIVFNDSTNFDGEVVLYSASSGFTPGYSAVGISEPSANTTLYFNGCEL